MLLADDKKKLSERCEALVQQLKRTDEQYSGALKRLEEESASTVKRLESAHASELGRLQELHAASEKLRREKWVEEKAARIRELTVRGLEPEIQALVAKHREEVSRLKSLHEQELLAADEKAGSRYLRMVLLGSCFRPVLVVCYKGILNFLVDYTHISGDTPSISQTF